LRELSTHREKIIFSVRSSLSEAEAKQMKIFITGASGYIGGSFAAHLAAKGHQIRGLIRNESRTEELQSFSIEPVVGTLDDSDLLMVEAQNSDAVINAADSDHRGAVEALLKGLEGSGKPFFAYKRQLPSRRRSPR